jgi:hypothetical protein
MGIIGIAITDESGIEISRVVGNTHLLDAVLFDLDGEQFCCLASIDPYGDTVFNRLQIPRLAKEWAALEASIVDRESKEVSNQVQVLIERARQTPHQYLKFFGD